MSNVPQSLGDERFYPSEWGSVPSVTTIQALLNKPLLIPWAAGQAVERLRPIFELLKNGLLKIEDVDIDKVLDEAKKEHRVKKEEGGDIGKKMHEFIANYYRAIRNGTVYDEARRMMCDVLKEVADPRILRAWEAFLKWDDLYSIQPIHVELPVTSHYRYGGRLDLYGLGTNGKAFVIDFKSAKAIYPEVTMQIAAYSNALQETDPRVEHIDGWGCLRLDKETGEPEWQAYGSEEIQVALDRFLKLTEYWHLTNNWNAKVREEKKDAKKKAKAERKIIAIRKGKIRRCQLAYQKNGPE